MEQDVQARGDVHGCGAGFGVVGVYDAEDGFEGSRGDAGFEVLGGDVEDGGAGGFGASSCCRGDCDGKTLSACKERLLLGERTAYWQ